MTESVPEKSTQFRCDSTLLVTTRARTTRRPFMDGFVETTRQKNGRLAGLRFVYRGHLEVELDVDYRARKGRYWVDFVGGVTYRRGWVEDVCWGHLMSAQRDVSIEDWVADMEAQFFMTALRSRADSFIRWAIEHGVQQSGCVELELMSAMEAMNLALTHGGIEPEAAEPRVQVMWSICSALLGLDVRRALGLFDSAWPHIKGEQSDTSFCLRQVSRRQLKP